jgi:hypothetical protein
MQIFSVLVFINRFQKISIMFGQHLQQQLRKDIFCINYDIENC